MLKIVVAMLIGAGLGAAITHELMDTAAQAPAVGAAIPAERAASGPLRGTPPVPVSGLLAAPPVPGNAGAVMPGGPAMPGRDAAAGGSAGFSAAPEILEDARVPRYEDAEVAAAANFAAAFTLVMARSDIGGQQQGLMALAQRWLLAAPTEAIAALDRLTRAPQRQAYLTALTSEAIARQPDLLLAIAERVRGVREQGGIMAGMYQGINAVENPEALLALVPSLPVQIGEALENAVYNRMAYEDPLNALARFDSMPQSETRQRLLQHSLTQLTVRDPEGALSWISAHSTSVDSAVYRNIAMMLGHNNPDLAAHFAPSVPEAARAEWIAAAASGMAAVDADAALNWLGTYRNTAYYDDALAGVAQQLAGFDPARAAQLVAGMDSSSMRARAAVTSVTMVWSQSDPDAAYAWARDLPRGSTRDTALASLAGSAGEAFLTPATLDMFDSPQMRDGAIGSVIARMAWSDPERAEDLIAEHVTNPEQIRQLTALVQNGGRPGGNMASFISPIGFGPAPVSVGGNTFYAGPGGSVPQFVGAGGGNIVIRSAAGPGVGFFAESESAQPGEEK